LPVLQYDSDSITSEPVVMVLAYPKVILNRNNIEKDKQDIVNSFKSKVGYILLHFMLNFLNCLI
jgi:hypothetical protein